MKTLGWSVFTLLLCVLILILWNQPRGVILFILAVTVVLMARLMFGRRIR
jgi:hypothetical protein